MRIGDQTFAGKYHIVQGMVRAPAPVNDGVLYGIATVNQRERPSVCVFDGATACRPLIITCLGE